MCLLEEEEDKDGEEKLHQVDKTVKIIHQPGHETQSTSNHIIVISIC